MVITLLLALIQGVYKTDFSLLFLGTFVIDMYFIEYLIDKK